MISIFVAVAVVFGQVLAIEIQQTDFGDLEVTSLF